MRWRPLAAAAAATLAAAAPAAAAEPILPLAEVQPGARCQGLTVVQGTTISSFDVEIVDVVVGDPVADQPLILIRVSGPVAGPTGIAQGYSGSPVVCDGRIAGAVAYGTGDYGNELGLATPIEAMLGQRVYPPPTVRRAPELTRRARPLMPPLTLTGLSPAVFAPFSSALAKAGLPVVAAPSAPIGARFGVQELVPGASIAAGLSSGDVALSAIGTVSYADGDRVWGFGHPFEASGRRSLLLQDAYVYTVVDNPLGLPGAVSYKLAAPGHDVGTLTSDGRNGIAGVVGATAPTIPLRVVARDPRTKAREVVEAKLADETDVGVPSGFSPSTIVVPAAVAQAAYTVLDGSPSQQSARMCVRIALRELDDPARFCKRYVGTSPATGFATGGPWVFDLYDALTQIDQFAYGTPHVESIDVRLDVEQGLEQAFLRRVSGPKRLRAGRSATLTLELQRYRGERFTRRVRLDLPRDVPTGRRTLRLTGTPADGDFGESIVITLDDGGGGAIFGGGAGPKSFEALARRIERIGLRDPVVYQLPPSSKRGRGGLKPRVLFVDRRVRISGRAGYDVRVLPPRRR